MTRRPPPSVSLYVARTHGERLRSFKIHLANASLVDPDHPPDLRSLLRVVLETGLEQKELAARLSVGQGTLSRWINGTCLPETRYQRQQLVSALVTILKARIEEIGRTPLDKAPSPPVLRGRTPRRRDVEPQ